MYIELGKNDEPVIVDCGHDDFCSECEGCPECGNCFCDEDEDALEDPAEREK